MTKNERIERMLVLANRLNAIVAELTAKKEALSINAVNATRSPLKSK
jgi:hypothetical protein